MKVRGAGGMGAELVVGLCDRGVSHCPLEDEDCDQAGYVLVQLELCLKYSYISDFERHQLIDMATVQPQWECSTILLSIQHRPTRRILEEYR